MNAKIEEIDRLPQGTVIRARGEIDLHYQPEFQRALLEVCREEPAILVIDLSKVDYMDSSGVGTLVQVARQIKDSGGKLVLAAPTPRVKRILEITRLDRYFTISATCEEALEL